jgi:hypothetical protein
MISSTLEVAFQPKMNWRDATIAVRVQVTPSKLMSQLADGLMNEVWRLVPYSEYKPTADLTSEDILKYLKTLTWMRCRYVTSDFSEAKAFAEYRNLYHRVEVPALAYQLFLCVGEAYDRDYAIKFLPEYQIESSDLLSVEDMSNLSDLLVNLRTIGFASVTGMPHDREGELDFMAMSHVEELSRSYRNSHPVYGFLASFFAQQQLNEVTGTMCRVLYGYDSDYKLYVASLLRALSAKQPEVRNEAKAE